MYDMHITNVTANGVVAVTYWSDSDQMEMICSIQYFLDFVPECCDGLVGYDVCSAHRRFTVPTWVEVLNTFYLCRVLRPFMYQMALPYTYDIRYTLYIQSIRRILKFGRICRI